MTELRINPYTYGRAVRGEADFFGREKLLEDIQQELQNPGTTSIVLSGQRRIGKTSILRQLQLVLLRQDFFPVYFDLQDQAQQPLGTLLRDLAEEALQSLGRTMSRGGEFDNDGRYFLRTFLPDFMSQLAPDCRPVFLFDEFDVLDNSAQQELTETSAAKKLFPFLRQVMEQLPRVAFVFVVGRRPGDLSIDVMSVFKASVSKEVWVLDDVSARQLLLRGQTAGDLLFRREAVEKILRLTEGHPYFIQLLCGRIWDSAHVGERESSTEVSESDVERALEDAFLTGEHAFVWLWNGLGPAEKIYSAALAEIGAEDYLIHEDEVIRVLAQHAPRLRAREVEVAVHDLVERRVLTEAGNRQYKFAIEMFRLWVSQNRSVDEVKHELDALNEQADRIFLVGRQFFQQRKWDDAIRYFQDSLRESARHFGARLHLGEALLEVGQLQEAITELELAYRMDPNESRYALTRAYITLSAEYLNNGEETEALVATEQALKISPSEPQAVQIQREIWETRGDAARSKKDYQTAEDCYIKAKAQEKLADVQRERLEAEIHAHEEKARVHEERGEWAQAVAIYSDLLQCSPQDAHWQSALEHSKEEVWLQEKYAEGLGHQRNRDWDQAIAAFVAVIARRSNYLDVDRRLVYVNQQKREFDIADEPGGKRKPRLPRYFALIGVTLTVIAASILFAEKGQVLFRDLVAVFAEPEATGDLPASPDTGNDNEEIPTFTPSADNEPPSETDAEAVESIPDFTILDIEALVTDVSREALIEPVTNLGLEAGETELLGVPIYHGWELGTETRHLPDQPEAATLALNIDSVKRVIVLIQADWGLAEYEGLQVGQITLVFSTGTVEVPLTLGENIRDWSRDGLNAVSEVSSPSVVEAWRGTAPDGRPGGMDFLVIDIPVAYHHEALEQMVISDTSQSSTGSIDTGIHVLAVTVAHTERVYPNSWLRTETSVDEEANLNMHTNNLNDVAWSPDGSLLASASLDGSVRLWEAPSFASTVLLSDHDDNVYCIAWQPGSHLLVEGTVGMAKIWDVDAFEWSKTLRVDSWVSSASWAPEGGVLAVGLGSGDVLLWDSDSERVLRVLEGERGNEVNSVVWAPDGLHLAADSFSDAVTVWNVLTGEAEMTMRSHTDDVNAVAWAPNGRLLASGARDNSIIIWDALTGEQQATLQTHTDWIHALSWHPDSITLASGSRDGLVIIWDTMGASPIHTLSGHTDWVHGVSWSPDGQLLASASVDRTIRVWNRQ